MASGVAPVGQQQLHRSFDAPVQRFLGEGDAPGEVREAVVVRRAVQLDLQDDVHEDGGVHSTRHLVVGLCPYAYSIRRTDCLPEHAGSLHNDRHCRIGDDPGLFPALAPVHNSRDSSDHVYLAHYDEVAHNAHSTSAGSAPHLPNELAHTHIAFAPPHSGTSPENENELCSVPETLGDRHEEGEVIGYEPHVLHNRVVGAVVLVLVMQDEVEADYSREEH